MGERALDRQRGELTQVHRRSAGLAPHSTILADLVVLPLRCAQFKLTGVSLGHGSYVNSVAYLHPTLAHPNGLIASGSLSSLILIHEGPSNGAWASNVDGEEGQTPGRDTRNTEDPIKTLVGHASNVCSLSVSAPPLSQPNALQTLRLASSAASKRSRKSTRSRPSSSSSFQGAKVAFGAGPTTTTTPPPSSPSLSTFNLTLPSLSQGGSSTPVSPITSSFPIHSGSPVPTPAPPANDDQPEQLLISTSWDCTARVWGTREWDEKLVLEGHKEAVWAGVIVEGIDCGRKDGERSFLTGESLTSQADDSVSIAGS